MQIVSTTLSLVLLTVLTVSLEKVTASKPPIEVAQTQSLSNNLVSVVLFQTVDVVLKDKSSLTATLTAFDSKKQTIEVSRDGVSRSLPINLIQEIIFRQVIEPNECKKQSCKIIMRGPKTTLSNIPLSAFVLLDSKQGQASLDPTTAENTLAIKFISPEPDEILYVDKIQFETIGKMTITLRTTKRQIDHEEE
jgi:hypothetical protein